MHKPSMATQAGSVRTADAGGETAAVGSTEKHALPMAQSAEQKMQTWRGLQYSRSREFSPHQLGWEPHSYIPVPAREQGSVVEAKAECFVVGNVCQDSLNRKPKFYSSFAGHILGPELKTT